MTAPTSAPRLLTAVADWTTTVCEIRAELSMASTVTSPIARTLPPAIVAAAPLDTLLEATTPPTLRPALPKPPSLGALPRLPPLRSKKMEAPEPEMFSLPASASICTSSYAVTRTSPAATSTLLVTVADAMAGVSPPKADEIRGDPSTASTRLKSTLLGCQPTELKASTTLLPSMPEIVETAWAVRAEALVAVTTMSPPEVVVMLLLVTVAVAEASRTFVVTSPPVELTSMALSSVAHSEAASSAETTTSPPAVTVVLVMLAVLAEERREKVRTA